MRRFILSIAFLVAALASAFAQQSVRLDLDRVVQLAKDSSLVVRRYQSEFDASLFSFRSWQASLKPQLTLDATPLQFERYMTRRYLSDADVDIYRQQRYLYSDAGVTARQTVTPLGGELYMTSQLGFLRTFGDTGSSQFMTIPLPTRITSGSSRSAERSASEKDATSLPTSR